MFYVRFLWHLLAALQDITAHKVLTGGIIMVNVTAGVLLLLPGVPPTRGYYQGAYPNKGKKGLQPGNIFGGPFDNPFFTKPLWYSSHMGVTLRKAPGEYLPAHLSYLKGTL